MCEHDLSVPTATPTPSRRVFLAGATVATVALARPLRTQASRHPPRAVTLSGGPPITPRASWGGDLAPKAPLAAEEPGGVLFLLVHHTAMSNSYSQGEVPGILRGIYDFHTGAEKGWPDVAYNFFVDRYGGIWEGRTGSLTSPIKGDATGGSQGHAMLCCFMGEHTTTPPTSDAQSAMVALLAWLAGTYNIDTSPGATVSFVSRGSNKWPAGSTVTATTISGHREMSSTSCPGDAAFPLVKTEFPARVTQARGASVATTSAPSTSPTTSTSTGSPGSQPSSSSITSVPEAPTTAVPTTEASPSIRSTPTSGASESAAPGISEQAGDGADRSKPVLFGGLLAVVAGALGYGVLRRRSTIIEQRRQGIAGGSAGSHAEPSAQEPRSGDERST